MSEAERKRLLDERSALLTRVREIEKQLRLGPYASIARRAKEG